MRNALFAAALLLAPVAASPQALDPFKTASDDRAAVLHYQTGWDLLLRERWDAAGREFQAAIDLKPNYKLAHYGLGRAAMGEKRFGKAVRAYEKCRELYAQQASENIVNAQEGERLLQDDLTSIDLAISRLQAGPQTPQTSGQITQLVLQKEQLRNRTGNANNMSLTSAVPAFVSLALGSAYFRSERFADAERAYRQAITSDSSYGEAHNNMAALYLTTGRYADAGREVAAAEKAGFRVNPGLKAEIKRKSGS